MGAAMRDRVAWIGVGWTVLLLLWLILLAGCVVRVDLEAVVRELRQDPATVFLTVPVDNGTLRLCRTGAPVGRVTCTADGLTLTAPEGRP